MTPRRRASLLAAAVTAAALAIPATASAATVSVSAGTGTYLAAAGETNHLSVTYANGNVQFYDTGVSTMTAGTGCKGAGPQKVTCPAPSITALSVDLGDQNDWMTEFLLVPATIFGSAGNDTIYSGAGNDTISGGAGGDTINGGWGNDLIDGNEGPDAIDGGPGKDTVTYATRTAPVTVTVGDGVANDGEAGEGDRLTSTEVVAGGSGNDNLTGDAANNELYGAGGDDTLAGAGGNDLLDGGSGTDTFDGGAGADTVKARDGAAESVACGTEADTVEADYSDVVALDCESVDKTVAPPDPGPGDPGPGDPGPGDPGDPGNPDPGLPVVPPPPTGGGTVVDPPVASVSSAPAKVSASGVVKLHLACPRDAFAGCEGTVEIVLLIGKHGGVKAHMRLRTAGGAVLQSARRRKVPARRHFRIAAGRSANVPVKLDRRSFRKIRKRRHLKAQVTVTMNNAAGTTTTTNVITLRRNFKPPKPKPSKHRRK